MRHLSLASVSCLAIIGVIGLVAPPLVAGQVSSSSANTFQTPWGAPDLQGIWANDVSTPLERPSRFADKEALTQEELARFTVEQQQSRENRDRRDQGPGTVTDVGRAYNAFWFPVPGDPIERTSLIVDPPDGRIPPYKPEALERFAAWAATKGRTGSAATPLAVPKVWPMARRVASTGAGNAPTIRKTDGSPSAVS